MPAQDEVRKASKGFYAALNSMLKGDAGPLAGIWSHGAAVTTMHPIGGRQAGWGKVKATWEQVAKSMSDGQVKLNDQLIRVVGDLAYEVGTEKGHSVIGGQKVAIEHRVTNVYRREVGGWKIVHHHADVSPAMLEVVSRLQGKKQVSRFRRLRACTRHRIRPQWGLGRMRCRCSRGCLQANLISHERRTYEVHGELEH
jgi:ketosteroid isomerase-like protein